VIRAEELLHDYQHRLDRALDHWLPPTSVEPAKLHEAMRYMTMAGGKRIRPALLYAAGRAVGTEPDKLDGAACAVELVHTFSLVHDDLPAMDDDDLRRGRPTCHKVFGEAMALLAGDALQSLAFHIVAHDNHIGCAPEVRLKMVDVLAQATGSRGMAGGQAIDLESVGKSLTIAELEYMHIHKTGALIRASVLLGALSRPGVNTKLLEQLDHFGKCIGLAFQIQDDILDVEADTATLGKPQGSDVARNKPTYPAIAGMKQAKDKALELYQDAIVGVSRLGDSLDPLRALAHYIVHRTH